MFASLTFEREPLKWADFPQNLIAYVQDVGGFAAAGLAIWGLVRLLRRRQQAPSVEPWGLSHLLMAFCAVGAGLIYLSLGVIRLPEFIEWLAPSEGKGTTAAPLINIKKSLLDTLLTVGGALAIVAVLMPLLVDLPRLRWRRIWALARLSFKDAIRRKVLWVFLGLLLVFLFGSWFIDAKPEHQVRSYVTVIDWAMTYLLLITVSLLAALSIPTDIRQQTIHTVLTKPVERFEIVLGRFLGYSILMTVVLVVMTGLSLLYFTRELHPEARYESYKARVPIYGDLEFYDVEPGGEAHKKPRGENVGREFDYRQYIIGKDPARTGAAVRQYAVWNFMDVPSDLSKRPTVPCEFDLDIYRTTKGEQVLCTFIFRAWHAGDRPGPGSSDDPFEREKKELLEESHGEASLETFFDEWLALKYGYYRYPNKEIVDYHTFAVEVPAALFEEPRKLYERYDEEAKAAPAHYQELARPLREEMNPAARAALRKDLLPQLRREEDAMSPQEHRAAFLYRELPTVKDKINRVASKPADPKQPKVQAWVRCDTQSQFIGMAKYDLYLLDANQPFELNFFKGAVGLWLQLVLVTGVAVACSTYLSGVITWILTMFLYVLGLIREFIRTLAEGTAPGGGPMESLVQLANRQNVTAQMEDTAASKVAGSSDVVFRRILHTIMNLIPDLDRFYFTNYVAEGFDIPLTQLLLSFAVMAGYVLPWIVLGYYLMKWREVASST